jgi:predicted enzyme related to lactoylglutathione lyase
MRIFRIGLPVSDIAASCAFYETLLDVARDDTVPSRVYFHCADVIVALIDQTVEGRERFQPSSEHVYLATKKLDEVYSRAVEVGARIDAKIETRPWGERSFYCRDLDGNRLCFVDDTTLFTGRGAEWR